MAGMAATRSAKSRELHFDGIVLADLHEPLEAALVVDGACHPDRLVGRAEMGVAAHLHGDVAAQAAQGGEILALGGFGQLPPHMQLDGALGVRPPLSTTRVGVPRWRTRWPSLARMSPASRSTTTACICDDVMGAGLALLPPRCPG